MAEEKTAKKAGTYKTAGICVAVFFIMLAAAETVCYIRNDSLKPEFPVMAAAFLLTAALIAAYVDGKKRKPGAPEFPEAFVPLLLLLSAALLFAADNMPFYMAGGVLLARHKNVRFGLLSVYELTFFAGALSSNAPEGLRLHLLLGTLLVLLFPRVRSVLSVLYLMIAEAAAGLAFCLLCRLCFRQEYDIDIFTTLVLYAALAAVCCAVSFLYERLMKGQAAPAPETPALDKAPVVSVPEAPALNETPSKTGETDPDEESQNRLRELVKADCPHLAAIKEEDKELFAHLEKTAEISCGAAEAVGADALLAKAGGYYHDIGKWKHKASGGCADYVEAGVSLAKEWGLPEALIALISEHNVEYCLPHSKEAAIVMLTDTILVAVGYTKETASGQIKPETVINHSMNHRLLKGTLNFSGLSLAQYAGLYQYYLACFTEGQKLERETLSNEKSFQTKEKGGEDA